MRVHGIWITQLSTDWLVQKVGINYLLLHRLLGTEDGHFYAVQHRKNVPAKNKKQKTWTEKAENNMSEPLAVREACKSIFWPTRFKRENRWKL